MKSIKNIGPDPRDYGSSKTETRRSARTIILLTTGASLHVRYDTYMIERDGGAIKIGRRQKACSQKES